MLWPVLINDDNRRRALFVCLIMESLSMLIVTFQLQYCKSSSGDEVNCLHVTMCSTLVCCYWCILILIIILVVDWWSLIGSH